MEQSYSINSRMVEAKYGSLEGHAPVPLCCITVQASSMLLASYERDPMNCTGTLAECGGTERVHHSCKRQFLWVPPMRQSRLIS